MQTVELGVRCKTPDCKGIPSLGMITVESISDLKTLMNGFPAKHINCSVCGKEALYSREDLVAGPLQTWDSLQS